MPATIVLNTGSFHIVFDFTQTNKTKTMIESQIRIVFPPSMGGYHIQSIDTATPVSDLKRLCQYFGNHIATRAQQRGITFMPEFMNFTVQALVGDILSDIDGRFTMRFMVNIGADPLTKSSVYAGYEAAVEVSEIMEFISSIKGFLNQIQ